MYSPNIWIIFYHNILIENVELEYLKAFVML